MKLRAGAAVALILASVSLLAGCATAGPEEAAKPAKSDKPTASGSASPSSKPSPAPEKTLMPLPGDCRKILSDDVLAQLKDVPLNDPGFGDSGLLDDGSLVCNWGSPDADTTGLTTKISRMDRGPALDMLNELAATDGFTCYTPDDGTRCEKTWQNEQYPVTDGRTLFWRDDLLIDTRYSNLAPKGYTTSIVEALWP
ncbi:hypothetical protein FVO59_09050 [Microbacterium esteraromaticum]|uniref:DUF3558 domain-containing protein n=1 Tax=Microbacterium esteraromaticum TaxID=57043 RepID=A0A7D7WG68_9MICO|nr:hypothetical protein [Microbacterium esteraromaticum]QMU97351.1 hypothetical protein FVO59_09050 [Microbacterium esteraromaticum]